MKSSIYVVLLCLLLFNDHCSCQRRGRLIAGVSQTSGFDCPEEFGYYSHPSDCTQYYVCVFGGALLESCTGGLMYSHELQTCDWPRNVGCGSEGASATVSTVRVTDPRTRHTTPTGQSPSRSTSGALRIQNEQQKRQQQEEIAKHQLYADDLGPAEEIESDRQQRVYRGQPSILGQVARDRDGLRHKPISNTLSSGSGQGANREKNEVISFGNQQQSINTQYSYDKLTQDENRLTNETIPLPARKKRQVRFRLPSQGPVLHLVRSGMNMFFPTPTPHATGTKSYKYQSNNFNPNNRNTFQHQGGVPNERLQHSRTVPNPYISPVGHIKNRPNNFNPQGAVSKLQLSGFNTAFINPQRVNEATGLSSINIWPYQNTNISLRPAQINTFDKNVNYQPSFVSKEMVQNSYFTRQKSHLPNATNFFQPLQIQTHLIHSHSSNPPALSRPVSVDSVYLLQVGHSSTPNYPTTATGTPISAPSHNSFHAITRNVGVAPENEAFRYPQTSKEPHRASSETEPSNNLDIFLNSNKEHTRPGYDPNKPIFYDSYSDNTFRQPYDSQGERDAQSSNNNRFETKTSFQITPNKKIEGPISTLVQKDGNFKLRLKTQHITTETPFRPNTNPYGEEDILINKSQIVYKLHQDQETQSPNYLIEISTPQIHTTTVKAYQFQPSYLTKPIDYFDSNPQGNTEIYQFSSYGTESYDFFDSHTETPGKYKRQRNNKPKSLSENNGNKNREYDSYETVNTHNPSQENYESMPEVYLKTQYVNNPTSEVSLVNDNIKINQRYPEPPPEIYRQFDEYKSSENPFASFDFNFDKYIETIRENTEKSSDNDNKDNIEANIQGEHFYQNKHNQKDEVTPNKTLILQKNNVQIEQLFHEKKPMAHHLSDSIENMRPRNISSILLNANQIPRDLYAQVQEDITEESLQSYINDRSKLYINNNQDFVPNNNMQNTKHNIFETNIAISNKSIPNSQQIYQKKYIKPDILTTPFVEIDGENYGNKQKYTYVNTNSEVPKDQPGYQINVHIGNNQQYDKHNQNVNTPLILSAVVNDQTPTVSSLDEEHSNSMVPTEVIPSYDYNKQEQTNYNLNFKLDTSKLIPENVHSNNISTLHVNRERKTLHNRNKIDTSLSTTTNPRKKHPINKNNINNNTPPSNTVYYNHAAEGIETIPNNKQSSQNTQSLQNYYEEKLYSLPIIKDANSYRSVMIQEMATNNPHSNRNEMISETPTNLPLAITKSISTYTTFSPQYPNSYSENVSYSNGKPENKNTLQAYLSSTKRPSTMHSSPSIKGNTSSIQKFRLNGHLSENSNIKIAKGDVYEVTTHDSEHNLISTITKNIETTTFINVPSVPKTQTFWENIYNTNTEDTTTSIPYYYHTTSPTNTSSYQNGIIQSNRFPNDETKTVPEIFEYEYEKITLKPKLTRKEILNHHNDYKYQTLYNNNHQIRNDTIPDDLQFNIESDEAHMANPEIRNKGILKSVDNSDWEGQNVYLSKTETTYAPYPNPTSPNPKDNVPKNHETTQTEKSADTYYMEHFSTVLNTQHTQKQPNNEVANIKRRPTTTYRPKIRGRHTTTTLPTDDFFTTIKTSIQTRPSARRKRPTTATRFKMTPLTVEEYQNDNDKGEPFTQPRASNTYQLNLRPSGNNAGHKIKGNVRVEPSPAPVTYIQQQPSQQTTSHTQSPSSFNSSQKYEPTQYDPYYNLYDEDVELYRDVDYGQLSSNAGPSSNTQYRSQSPYKQAPQPPQQEQRSASYAQPSYNTQDIYSQTLNEQDYNENFNSQQTDDQYQQQISPRQPVKSPARVRPTTAIPEPQTTPVPMRVSTPTRNRGTASYTATGVGGGELVNRGTPASVRSRPTLKPSTAIVSKAAEFVDVYKYPPRRPDPVYPTPQVDKTAAKCRKDVCLLPDCYCGGKEIPGGLAAEEIPQLVLLTFDDAVNDLNKVLYSDLFEKSRKNPNGCPISATYYVSHEWTDYSQVQNLYADGHEMASHSVSHSFGEQFSQKKWTKEISGQREILAAYGGVKLEDVRGMRAPFLAVGGNKMFKMLYDSNFTYDSSMPVYENRPPSFPYTLDYKLFHDCMIPPCPTRSYPGVWEVPMVMWQDLNGGRCSMGDACSNPPTADGVYKMLIKNFERHYTTNRAPFGLFYHAAWFTQIHHKEGFIAFLDTLVAMKDVWLVSNWQAIQWVRDPTPLSRINNFPPFQCDYQGRPKRCNNPKVCNLWHKSGVRYMRTCQPCPDIYPWTGKTGVRNSRVENDIVEES